MEITSAQAVTAAVLAVSMGTAAAVDVARRRIPNALSLATGVAGVALAAAGVTGISIWSSLAGFVIGLAFMLPGHVLGATGAGDVKLFDAAGTVLGAAQTCQAFLLVAIAGGLFALAFAVSRGRLVRTVAHTAQLVGRPGAMRARIEQPEENNRFPYGPAIAVGCVLAAVI